MASGTLGRSAAALLVLFGGAFGYYRSTGERPPELISQQLAAIPHIEKALPQFAAKPTAQAPAGAPQGAGPAGGGRPPVPVLAAKVEKRDMPVRLDALGTVAPISTVTLRARAESQIMEVAFQDGASVKAGDVLFRLDSRQIEAQLRQAEANLARDRAQLQANEADLRRAQELARRDFASEQRLDQAKATAESQRAVVRATEANIENLKVQLSYYTITAPIPGRVGVAGLKVGNIAKTGDNSVALATINQTSPIYVSFAVPQRYLLDLKNAIGDASAAAAATPQGLAKTAIGRVAVVDNTVDPTTGTITARAAFENADELLWPGALCNVRLTLRTEKDAVTVPRAAVQTSQTGSFVFVIEGETARVRPVVVSRTVDDRTVIASGLQGDETVVTDGQLLLTNGARVAVRQPGGGQPGGGQRPQGTPSAQNQRPTQG
jgi:membrane fusion protein, multidrug efflux system